MYDGCQGKLRLDASIRCSQRLTYVRQALTITYYNIVKGLPWQQVQTALEEQCVQRHVEKLKNQSRLSVKPLLAAHHLSGLLGCRRSKQKQSSGSC
jgi:hypothetical protein